MACGNDYSRWLGRALLGAAMLASFALPAAAQRKEPTPQILEGVGITEHLDAQVPLDLEFVDCDGKKVTLAEVFNGRRPVILTLNYSDCPMLCIVQLNGLVDAIGKMDWTLGDQYEILTVSIDPLETSERARLTKQKYLKIYSRPGGAAGWHFFTSHDEANIKKVAETVGFGYRFDPVTKQYAHAAALMICTPDGRISRYLYGVQYDPQTLKFSLLEAGEGKIGTTVDRVIMYCFHYDAARGRYGPHAFRIMQLGGALTVVILAGMLSVYWLRERRGGRKSEVRDPKSETDSKLQVSA